MRMRDTSTNCRETKAARASDDEELAPKFDQSTRSATRPRGGSSARELHHPRHRWSGPALHPRRPRAPLPALVTIPAAITTMVSP